jgi:muramoyltetrapeptide carboxypeptidase
MHPKNTQPPFLVPGDTVAIVSTARKIAVDEVHFAKNLLENQGYKVILGKTIGAEDHQFAGSDALRAADFQSFLDDPKVKAIWCARGGYGTVRIINKFDFSTFQQAPKWIIGYSDVTVLHSHLHKLGCQTLHAPMPIDIEKQTETAKQHFLKSISGELPSYTVAPHLLNRTGTATGVLVGGNLSMLYSLCGSPTAIETKGKLLFLEDLDEYLYHIDRMLQNLKRNGMLEHLSGLVIGSMNKMNDNTIPFGKNAEEIIAEAVATYNFPMCFGFSTGHNEDNNPILLGAEVSLEVSESGSKLSF